MESSEFLEPAVVSLVNRPSTTSNFPESVVVSSISRLSNTSDSLESAVPRIPVISSSQPWSAQISRPSYQFILDLVVVSRPSNTK